MTYAAASYADLSYAEFASEDLSVILGTGNLGPSYGDFWEKASPRALPKAQKRLEQTVLAAEHVLSKASAATTSLLHAAREASRTASVSYAQVQQLRAQVRQEVARQLRRRCQQHLLLVEL